MIFFLYFQVKNKYYIFFFNLMKYTNNFENDFKINLKTYKKT